MTISTPFADGEPKAPAGVVSREAELGRELLWDERVSADGKTACATCHFARD
jgi:cytochrome c peroxidase